MAVGGTASPCGAQEKTWALAGQQLQPSSVLCMEMKTSHTAAPLVNVSVSLQLTN